MNTATDSFDTLLAEMSLAVDLAAELEGELKSASFTIPAPRSGSAPRTAQAASAFLAFGQPQVAY